LYSAVESEIVKKIRSGDKAAFKLLYTRYNKSLFILARQLLKDNHLAEDAVQDIFIKLWLTREKLNTEKSIKSFLFTCLKNHVLNLIRNQKRRIIAAYELKEAYHPVTNCTEDAIQFSEYQKILHTGLNSMPEKRREIYRLKMYEGLSNDQIAQKMEISINTVKEHYQLGRKFIKSYLKDHADVSYHS
jgi:RNA polymerase sigma-70 factor (family 1)